MPATKIKRVKSGSNGIESRSGDSHAEVFQGDTYMEQPTAFTRLGGYSDVFPEGGFDVSLDIYLDPDNAPTSTHFDYTVAANKADCNHLRDFVFSGGTDDSGKYCVGTTNGASTASNPCGPDMDSVEIQKADWFTFEHRLRKGQDDELIVTMRLLRANGNVVKSWNRSADGDVAAGLRYAWFPVNQFDFLAVDNSRRENR